MNLILLRGISGSGKSTFAETLRSQGFVIVSRDAIREMFKDYGSVNEDVVTKIQNAAIDASLIAGLSVCVDDTNIRPKYMKRFVEAATRHGANVVVKEFPIDVDEAIRRVKSRAAAGGRDVPEEVIRKQHQGFKSGKVDIRSMTPPKFEPYVNPGGPKVIIVDIDGTLALNTGHRGWYDYDRVEDDELVSEVADVANQYEHGQVIVMSGRDDSCREATERWLAKHGVRYDFLFMRKTGDMRNDAIVKMELFDEHVRNKYDVSFVIDDRPSVCRAWRSIGLKVFQVGDPHVEF